MLPGQANPSARRLKVAPVGNLPQLIGTMVDQGEAKARNSINSASCRIHQPVMDSSSAGFLLQLRTLYAILSLGVNLFGWHPSIIVK